MYRFYKRFLLIFLGLFYVFYFCGVRIFLFYYFSQPSKILNSVVLLSAKKIQTKEVKILFGEEEVRVYDLTEIKKEHGYVYYALFHDSSGIQAFDFGDEEHVGEVWVGKKTSFVVAPIRLVKLSQSSAGRFRFSAEVLGSFSLLGRFVIWTIDAVFLILGYIAFRKQLPVKGVIGVLGALFFSSFGVIPLLMRLQGMEEKLFVWIVWVMDVFLGVMLVGAFLLLEDRIFQKRKFSMGWRTVVLAWVGVLFFWNINIVNLSWISQRIKQGIQVVRGIFLSREERERMSYSGYGALYDVGRLVLSVTQNDRIGFPGGFLVFGNGSLVRRFIYPNVDMIINIKETSNVTLLLDYCRERDISYLVVVKKGMDSYTPWMFWPDFYIPCDGLYVYHKKKETIVFLKENYDPKKYLHDPDTYILIKLGGKK